MSFESVGEPLGDATAAVGGDGGFVDTCGAAGDGASSPDRTEFGNKLPTEPMSILPKSNVLTESTGFDVGGAEPPPVAVFGA